MINKMSCDDLSCCNGVVSCFDGSLFFPCSECQPEEKKLYRKLGNNEYWKQWEEKKNGK